MRASFLIVIALALSSAVLCAIFAMAYLQLGRRPHAKSWALSFGVAAAMFAVSLIRDLFPSVTSYWILSAAMSFTAVALGIRGHLQRVGKQLAASHLLITFGGFALLVWSTLINPHFGLQISLLPLHAAIFNGWAARLIVTFRESPSAVEWGAATSCSAFALCQLLAGLIALSQGATMNPETMALYSTVNFVAMPACFLGMGMFAVFILASDLAEEMRRLAGVDPLTGLANRRGMKDAMVRAWSSAQRADQPVSLLLADLDSFKKINDRYGHDAGDSVLKEVAERLTAHRRADDLVARWGGEEFVVMLTGPSNDEALAIARQIDARIQASAVHTLAGPVEASASIGVATATTDSGSIEELLRQADADMYERKVARKAERKRSLHSEAVPSLSTVPGLSG